MVAVHDLPLFLAASLLLNLTPGPDMLFVAGCGAARGWRAGVMAALGVGLGCGVHIALAALGVSALLAASPAAFAVLKWLGAAYLVWIGLRMLRAGGRGAPGVSAGADGAMAHAGRSAFWQGAVTNALNPKVAMFFLAFLPQFIAPGASDAAMAFVVLGLLFDIGGTLVNLAVAWLAHRLSQRFKSGGVAAGMGVWPQRVAGAVFVGLGLKLALGSR